MLVITPIYAALLALIFFFLSIRIIKLRRLHRVALGDNGKPILTRAIAAHQNFAQYVPFSLILILLIELEGAPKLFIHVLGILLVFARCMHAYGISQLKENFKLRTYGMMMTLSILLFSASFLLINSIQTLSKMSILDGFIK